MHEKNRKTNLIGHLISFLSFDSNQFVGDIFVTFVLDNGAFKVDKSI